MYNKQEIETVLAEGKVILDQRPELRRVSIDAVLDELDDGTQSWIGDREFHYIEQI